MNEEEYFEQLCSNSVDGTLTDSEKQKLEEHLAECPSCAALKEDLEQMHSMLAVDETEPPAGLHDSIMERLRQEETVRVVAPQKPMRRLPVFTMVAAAAVVVLVVLGGGLMPAFSTVGSGSTTAADSASADAGDGTADGGMQDEIEQSVQRNTDTSDSGASNASVQQSGTASQSANGSAYSGQNDTGEDSAANAQSDAGVMLSSMQTTISRSQRLSRLLRSRYRCRPVRCSRSRKACTAHTPRTAMWPSAAAACRILMVSCSRRRTAFRGSGWTTVWKRSKRLCR